MTTARALSTEQGQRLLGLLLDAGVVTLSVLPAAVWAHTADAGGPERLTVALGGLLGAALILVRRRAPVAACTGLAIVIAVCGGPALLYPVLLVAVATVAAERPLWLGAGAGLTATAALLAHRALWDEPIVVGTVISALATSGFAVFAGLYVGARRVQASSRAERAVAEERLRIARELHDVIAHNVSLMVVQAQALQVTAGPGREVAGAAEQIAGLGREAMSEMHRTLVLLRDDAEPAARAPQPGLADLDGLLQRTRSAGVDVLLRREGAERALASGAELSAYRIVQEALTNVVRHAPGATAVVVLRYGARGLSVLVEDDGGTRGAGGAPGRPGHGITGMRERAELFGGTLDAGPRADDRGFRVAATLPYAGASPR